MSEYNSISVVLPAYNEEDNIKKALTSIYSYLAAKFETFEIIVVSDGSTDRTNTIVKKLSNKFKNIHLVLHPKNKGYGSTLRSGFKTAKNDLIFYTDSDNQYNINDLDKLLNLVKKFDIVAGYRVKRKDPLFRIFIASVYNLIIKTLLGLNTKDIDCSFKIYKKEVIKTLKLKSKTGLIDAEILIKAQKKGFKVGQVGVSHFPRVKGRTIYEAGPRNKILAFVKPSVVINIFKEIKELWPDLKLS